MADIELVIKISEKAYNALTHTEFDANLVVDEMRKSIANGTPLNKIRAEIVELDVLHDNDYFSGNKDAMLKRNEVLQIIDKYKAESEG